jgi:tRNA pseudouridine55 synthase
MNPRPQRPRIPRRALHGVLLLDKPIGLSSNDALQKVKRLLRAEKAGHTGTLDPLATGLLPICFGAATKFSQVSLDADKAYRAVLRLGQRTVGGDREGEVIEERAVDVDDNSIAQACARFVGPIEQIPPMQSALKKDGKALYEYARAGIELEREPRRVTIHAIDIIGWDTATLELTLDVRCSKGTYIRTLGEDIGEAIGCGAHLGSLRRLETGGYTTQQCVSLPALEAMTEPEREACLLPPQTLVAAYPSVTLDADNAGRFLSGLPRRGVPGQWGADAPLVQVYGPGQGGEAPAFLGSAHITADELIPQRLLSPVEIQDILAAAQSSGHAAPAGAVALVHH